MAGSDAPGSLWDLPAAELPAGVELNLGDGEATVTVARGVIVEQPIALTSVVPDGKLANLRTRIVLEEGAQAEVWEQYLSAGDCLLNVATEIDAR